MIKVASRTASKLKSLWSDLTDKEVRDEYVSARIAVDLAHQIYSMRDKRGWTQEELSDRYGGSNTQSRISKLETSCENVTLNTLKKVASAFDVALSVKFVPFSQLIVESYSERLDKPVPSFDNDTVEPKVFSYSASVGRGSARATQTFATSRPNQLILTSPEPSRKVFLCG